MLFLFCVASWFYTTGASCFKVFPCSLSSCFFILFSIVITSLGEEGAGLCGSRAFVCLFCMCLFLSFFSSPWCRGLTAICDCGTHWTFLLTILMIWSITKLLRLTEKDTLESKTINTVYNILSCVSEIRPQN